MNELTHISLFAGIGGIDIAAEWAGFRTILFVEIDKYCQKVLNKHWPDVPIIGDIRDVKREKIQEIIANASRGRGGQEFNTITNNLLSEEKAPQKLKGSSGNGDRNGGRVAIQPITIITGGFPCQPVSHAGKRRGKEDDRWLWPEMFRVISEIRSTWVVAENVTGLLHLGFNDCISDLESIGYETTSFLIPACGVNAPHRRDRIFIVAFLDNASSSRHLEQSGKVEAEQNRNRQKDGLPISSSEDVADTQAIGIQRNGAIGEQEPRIQAGEGLSGCDCSRDGEVQWAVEPELGRVAHGIPHRVDRLKCLGNAVVPQQIYPILKAIADIERANVC